MSETTIYPITGLSFTPNKVIVSAYYINQRGYKRTSFQISSNTNDMYDVYGQSTYGMFGNKGEGFNDSMAIQRTESDIFQNGFNVRLDDVSSSSNSVVTLRYWAFEQ